MLPFRWQTKPRNSCGMEIADGGRKGVGRPLEERGAFAPREIKRVGSRIASADFLTASASSRGFKTFASPPQLKIQRSISIRLESFIRNSTPPPFNSRSCCDSCHFFSRT